MAEQLLDVADASTTYNTRKRSNQDRSNDAKECKVNKNLSFALTKTIVRGNTIKPTKCYLHHKQITEHQKEVKFSFSVNFAARNTNCILD